MASAFQSMIISSFMLLLPALAFAAIAPASVSAQGIKDNICGGTDIDLGNNEDKCQEVNPCVQERDGQCVARQSDQRLDRTVGAIVNIITIVVGVVAVVLIVIGGAKFITAGGDSGKIASARNTVIYAIVGLIIVALAQVIVRFVLSRT